MSLNRTEEKPLLMPKTEFFQIRDERLFLEYIFAKDFSYHTYTLFLLFAFFYLFQSVNLMPSQFP